MASLDIPLINHSFSENDSLNMQKDEYSRITVYIDAQKRQSVAIANGTEYNAVANMRKRINSNPAHYEYPLSVKIDHIWKSSVRYIMLIVFTVILLFLFLYKKWFSIWISLIAFQVFTVIAFYIMRCCYMRKWIKQEIQRLNTLIEQSNTNEYDNFNKNDKRHWSDYIVPTSNKYDSSNVNNMNYVYLRLQPSSKKDRNEEVIKMVIEIWLQKKIPNKFYNAETTEDCDTDLYVID